MAGVILALAVTACGAGGATFDPAGPCVVDGRAAGAYPDLEALLPTDLDGDPPTSVDSGRSCSADALGSLVSHDLESVTFAGATWDLGGGMGVSSVVFAADRRLPAAWIAEFYELGARATRKADHVQPSQPSFAKVSVAWRIDLINDLSYQSVVTWQDGERVRVVLVATGVSPAASAEAHDRLVELAVTEAAEAPSASD